MTKKTVFMIVAISLALFSCQNKTKEDNIEETRVYHKAEATDLLNSGAVADTADYTAFLKSNKEKFKIAVFQSGKYFSYTDVFEGILQGMVTLGWINDVPPLLKDYSYDSYEDGKTIYNIIQELNKTDYSDYVEISTELFFDLNFTDDNVNTPEFEKMTEADSNIDLIICLGTQMSKILSDFTNLKIPVLVDSISDPVGSEILNSIDDSGRDFLTGIVDPEQDLRQLKLFHSVIQFKTLGILYEDTDIGRSYGAVDDVYSVANENGFKVIANNNVLPDPIDDDDDDAWEDCEAQYIVALEELCQSLSEYDRKDVGIYLAVQSGLSEYSLEGIVEVLNKYKIASFVMEGKGFVEEGVLLGESDSNLLSKGIFNSKKIVNIFRGTKPRELNQKYEHVPHIAINLDTANHIGYDVTIDILSSADQIYKKEQ